jgi:hypothetical protein
LAGRRQPAGDGNDTFQGHIGTFDHGDYEGENELSYVTHLPYLIPPFALHGAQNAVLAGEKLIRARALERLLLLETSRGRGEAERLELAKHRLDRASSEIVGTISTIEREDWQEEIARGASLTPSDGNLVLRLDSFRAEQDRVDS